ncbi:hypothetical protein KTE19_06540 [Lentilactobacillus sp. IMAU92037]|uniref:hypothetical protein n=1 Tax=Lentilactobacillus dabitei TaxID=2831523 RepID=UPI001C266DE6|nr:hypothetical protein [Lentilactobacillus dabitei]MBU9790262.1 hypothetical protein [Lentilactobacillus dabitei]MBV0930370.1 hypothetical protein [Lentilactobacillus dabitei]
MSLDYPENMPEFEDKFAIEKARHPETTREGLMKQVIEDAFQGYLDEAEEGHYDTGKLVGKEIEVYGLKKELLKKIKPIGDSFEADFQKDGNQLMCYLEDQADRVAREFS